MNKQQLIDSIKDQVLSDLSNYKSTEDIVSVTDVTSVVQAVTDAEVKMALEVTTYDGKATVISIT